MHLFKFLKSQNALWLINISTLLLSVNKKASGVSINAAEITEEMSYKGAFESKSLRTTALQKNI